MSAVLAGAAGLTALTAFFGDAVVAGMAALAAIITTLETAWNPTADAAAHHAKGVAFNALRLQLRQFINVQTKLPHVDLGVIAAELKGFVDIKGELLREEPSTPSGRFYAKAKEAINAGETAYLPKELEAAVGMSWSWLIGLTCPL